MAAGSYGRPSGGFSKWKGTKRGSSGHAYLIGVRCIGACSLTFPVPSCGIQAALEQALTVLVRSGAAPPLRCREHKGWWMAVLGALVLISYGFVPTAQPVDNFGRVFAVYGGFFIILSYLWGWAVDGDRPDTGARFWQHPAWSRYWLITPCVFIACLLLVVHCTVEERRRDVPRHAWACLPLCSHTSVYSHCVTRTIRDCKVWCGDRRLDWQRHCTSGRCNRLVLAPVNRSSWQRSVFWFG